jgi:hypothetical protein
MSMSIRKDRSYDLSIRIFTFITITNISNYSNVLYICINECIYTNTYSITINYYYIICIYKYKYILVYDIYTI